MDTWLTFAFVVWLFGLIAHGFYTDYLLDRLHSDFSGLDDPQLRKLFTPFIVHFALYVTALFAVGFFTM